LRTLLYTARYCYSWLTGFVGSNDDGVTFLRERRVEGVNVGLIERALTAERRDPHQLFPARTLLASQIDAGAALLPGANGSAGTKGRAHWR
jgi:hypothetical protein